MSTGLTFLERCLVATGFTLVVCLAAVMLINLALWYTARKLERQGK